MWPVYFFLSYLVLALLIPICWVLMPVWRRARTARPVDCPDGSCSALVSLDAFYAAKMHALGNRGLRIKSCSEWPQRSACSQQCLR